MAARLAFYGTWTESEERPVEEAIRWKESRLKLPPRQLGEPWLVMRRDAEEGSIFLAHRHSWPRPVEAASPEELAAAIRNR